MNRKEAEDYVYQSYLKAEKHQDYHKKDSEKRKPQFSKEIIRSLAGTPCVSITGSKGKGSVACMAAQILQSELKVGLMTSPHLRTFNERFRINGNYISDDDFVNHMEKIKVKFDEVEKQLEADECISPMGIQAAVALSFFNENETDFNVFEHGKGARFDDVNNVKHEYAIINSIFLEHTRELGSTIEEIARNKAAIITGEQKVVYTAMQQPEALAIIKEKAEKENVPLKVYGEDFYAENICFTKLGMKFDVVIGKEHYTEIMVPLLGEHQARNCALAMAFCVDVLKEKNIVKIRKLLRKMNWQGRLEVISSEPFIMLDACINRTSCPDIKRVLKELNLEKITTIIGIPDDKDYIGVAEAMKDISENIILTKSTNLHYTFTDIQQKNLHNRNIVATCSDNVDEALKMARENGNPILILGTTALVSEVKRQDAYT